MEKNSPYFLFEKVGPWEEEINNPFIRNTTIESFFNKLTNTIHEKKLPMINALVKNPKKNKKELSLTKNQNLIEIPLKNKGNLTEKTKKNFLLPRRKAFKTIHIQETKKTEAFETENMHIIEKNTKENEEIAMDFKPILNISKKTVINTHKKTFQIKTIDRNQGYFTINPKVLQQMSYNHTNTLINQSFSKEKSSDFRTLPQDFCLKGLEVGKFLQKSLHFNQNTDKIKKRNSNSMHRIFDEKEIKERTEKNLRDVAIKIKIDHLKKIDKNSTHFLKHFLLKYDEDFKKKQRFLNVKNCQLSQNHHI